MTRRIIIRGQQFLTFGDAAQCFSVAVRWVEEVYESGLIGVAEQTDAGPALPAALLERLATIRRLELQQGVDLAAIALLLDLLEQ